MYVYSQHSWTGALLQSNKSSVRTLDQGDQTIKPFNWMSAGLHVRNNVNGFWWMDYDLCRSNDNKIIIESLQEIFSLPKTELNIFVMKTETPVLFESIFNCVSKLLSKYRKSKHVSEEAARQPHFLHYISHAFSCSLSTSEAYMVVWSWPSRYNILP